MSHIRYLFITSVTILAFAGISLAQQKISVVNNDVKAAEATVIKFLHWYKNNRNQLMSVNLVNGDVSDTTKAYTSNPAGFNQYLQKLSSSHLVSNIFISDIRQRLANLSLRLKLRPVYGGPVEELGTDLIYGTMELDLIENNTQNMRLQALSQKGSDILLVLYINKAATTNAYLNKRNDKWLIDHLCFKFRDEIIN